MRLNSPRRLAKEDYPSKYRDITDKLVDSLNDFMSEVSQGFNKRLNYKDNFEAFDIELDIVGGQPTKVKNELQTVVRGITILRVDTLSNSSEVLSSGPFAQFTNTTGQITINNITGLTPGNKYRIRAVFYA